MLPMQESTVLQPVKSTVGIEKELKLISRRPAHDRQSIPHWTHSLLYWLCTLRDSVQHHPQAHIAQNMVANVDAGMGTCFRTPRRDA
jgi:hypothetical protein